MPKQPQPLSPEEWDELRTRRQRGGRISNRDLDRVLATLDAQAAEIARLRTKADELYDRAAPDNPYRKEPSHVEPV